jgi:hypothetical protein
MNSIQRLIATAEMCLVFPAALFMTSLFLRELQPAQYEPARTARRLVDWFSARPFLGLDILLIALPLTALVVGSTAVVRSWRTDASLRRAVLGTLVLVRSHLATLLIAGTTLMAGGILAIVAMHMITD